MTKQTKYFIQLCLERYRHRFTNKVINKIRTYLSSYNRYEFGEYYYPQYIFTPTQKKYVDKMFDPSLIEWDRDLYRLFTPYSPGHNYRLNYNSIKFDAPYTDEEDSDSDPFADSEDSFADSLGKRKVEVEVSRTDNPKQQKLHGNFGNSSSINPNKR